MFCDLMLCICYLYSVQKLLRAYVCIIICEPNQNETFVFVICILLFFVTLYKVINLMQQVFNLRVKQVKKNNQEQAKNCVEMYCNHDI